MSDETGRGVPPPQQPAGYRPPGERADHSSAAPGDEPAESSQTVSLRVPQFLTKVRARHVVSLLIGQGIAYVTLLLMAVLACLLMLLSLAVEADVAEVEIMAGDFGDLIGTPDFTDLVSMIVIPFQVVAVWLFGTLRFEIGMPEFFAEIFSQFGGPQASAEMSFTAWAPNLLVLGLALWISVWLGRKIARRGAEPLAQLPVLAKLLVSLVVSAALAGLAVLFTWAVAFRQSVDAGEAMGDAVTGEDLDMMSEYLGISADEFTFTFYGSAAGWALFWGAFGFFLLVGLLMSTKRGLFGAAFARISSVLPSITRTPRVMVIHSMVIIIPVLAYVCIRSMADGSPEMVLTVPMWGSTVAVIGFILLTSGAVHGSGELRETIGLGASESGSMTSYLWSGGASGFQDAVQAEDEWLVQVIADGLAWWEVLLAALLGLFALFLASLSWSMIRQNPAGATGKVLSFLTLPVAYAVLGAVLTVFGQMRMEISMFDLMSGQVSLGPVWWSFLILLIVGAIIEGLGRVCAAFISGSVPAPLRRILAGKQHSTPAPAVRQGAPVTGPPAPPGPGPSAPDAGNSPTMP